MNKILFGGAFDPIHLGHINMAEEASKALDADVIFIPAPISVWKNESAPIEDKIKMVELAIEGHKRFSIDRFEIDSGKPTTYSIETAENFVKKYPNDKFFYLIGTDHVNSFHKWKEAKKLSEIVEIVFFERPGLELDAKNIEEFHMKKIPGNLVDISSTDIRSLRDLKLDDKVIEYIQENNLYYMKSIASYLGEKRLKHSIQVAMLALKIAKANKLENPEKYYIAGLLHDIGKEFKDSEKIMHMEFEEEMDLGQFAYHQFVGSYLAIAEFGIQDKSIIDAIKYHATGNENMDILAKVIYASDKIEPTRSYDSTEFINAMMNDAEKGFITVLDANIEFLKTKGKSFDNRLTSKCVACYLK